jgi:general nucleoside transport system ATP-binding protein
LRFSVFFSDFCVTFSDQQRTVTTALALTHITKRFGALVANSDISLTVERGEVLGLLGENGAGKSTLVSILFGHYVADSGSIEVFGKPLKSGDPKAALAAGIGIVQQHFALADNLSVLDNVVLGTESLWSFATKRKAAYDHLTLTSAQFGLDFSPDTLVGSLSVGQKQRVEILKALYRGAKLLILDEPTAVLTPQESEQLFATLQSLTEQGMAIIFISHKLGEVLRVCDRVAVLRAGKLVAQADVKGNPSLDAAQLAQWMVGQSLNARAPRVAPSMAITPLGALDSCHGGTAHAAPFMAALAAAPALELRDVHARLGDREKLVGVNLQLFAGQITAIAGVSGNGQLAFAQLLCGQLQAKKGEFLLNGQAAPASVGELVAAGVARIPEDRKGTGVVADLSFWENAVSESLPAPTSPLVRWGLVREAAARAHAAQIVARFDVRGAVQGSGANAPIARLSGGNMQKLVIGRALMPVGGQPVRVVVAHQPTWGLDIGAVQFVHSQLLAARDAGAAVLFISDDLDEIFDMADHVAVLHNGALTSVRPLAQWSRTSIGLAMAGSDAGHVKHVEDEKKAGAEHANGLDQTAPAENSPAKPEPTRRKLLDEASHAA